MRSWAIWVLGRHIQPLQYDWRHAWPGYQLGRPNIEFSSTIQVVGTVTSRLADCPWSLGKQLDSPSSPQRSGGLVRNFVFFLFQKGNHSLWLGTTRRAMDSCARPRHAKHGNEEPATGYSLAKRLLCQAGYLLTHTEAALRHIHSEYLGTGGAAGSRDGRIMHPGLNTYLHVLLDVNRLDYQVNTGCCPYVKERAMVTRLMVLSLAVLNQRLLALRPAPTRSVGRLYA